MRQATDSITTSAISSHNPSRTTLGPFRSDQEAALAHERAKPARRRALASLRRLREDAAETIEHLIAFLDAIDADDDREDDDADKGEPTEDSEPSLGAPERWAPAYGSQIGWAAGGDDDRELDNCDREDDARSRPKTMPDDPAVA